MENKIAQSRTLGINYEILDRTGIVDQSDTRRETEVEESASGGWGAGGYTAPVAGSVSSKTTRFQNIFLTDNAAKKHSIELQNFMISYRPGQRLAIFLLTHGKRKIDSYFKTINRNTCDMFNHAKAIRGLCKWPAG